MSKASVRCVATLTVPLLSAHFLLFVPGTLFGEPSTAFDTEHTGAKTFYADERAGNNQVTVFSESTLEDFTGVCNRVAGQAILDPKRIESFSGSFSIRVEDLKTGLELRDQHMIGPDWLNIAEHPLVTIKIENTVDVQKSGPTTATGTLVGQCQIRGTTRPIRIPANLTYLDETPETMRRVKGDLLRVRAEFAIKLADYGIVGPAGSDFIGLKVSETVKVKVAVFASTERPPEPLKVDRPQETAKRAPVPPTDRQPTSSTP